jgi:hypothetical protein
MSYLESLFFAVLRERNLGSTAGAERKGGNCRQTVVGGSSMRSPPLMQLCQEFKLMINIHISKLEN